MMPNDVNIRQPWLSLLYFFVSSRSATALFTVFAWVIVLQLWLWKRFQIGSRGRASPYYLSRRPDGQKPAPLDKKLYVDPFE